MVAKDKSLCVTGYMQLKRIPIVEVKAVRQKSLSRDARMTFLMHQEVVGGRVGVIF